MVIIAIVVYAWLFVFFVSQLVSAHEKYSFTWRQCHGKRTIYVRSRKTGRVALHTRNLWDLMSLSYEQV